MKPDTSHTSTPRTKQTFLLGFGGLAAASGDHIAHFYSSPQEWQDLLVGYLLAGIEAGDKCVSIAHSRTDSNLMLRAQDGGEEAIRGALSSGQLVLLEGDKPDGMRQKLTDALAEVPQRYPRLRWVGNMTWSLGKCSTPELMEWESHCNGFPDSPIVFLCQYELKAFTGQVVMHALQTHPVCIVGTAIHRNPYFVDPGTFLESLTVAGDTPWPSKDGENSELEE